MYDEPNVSIYPGSELEFLGPTRNYKILSTFTQKKIFFGIRILIFNFGGYVNKQYCSNWGAENPERGLTEAN